MKSIIVLIFFIVFLNSCGHQGVSWDPNFFMPDVEEQAIISESGHAISFNDPAVERYACLSEQKLNELIEILLSAEIPKRYKKKIMEVFEANR